MKFPVLERENGNFWNDAFPGKLPPKSFISRDFSHQLWVVYAWHFFIFSFVIWHKRRRRTYVQEGYFPKKIMFSHKNGIFCKRELWTSLAAAAALSSCCCVKTVYGIWIYTSVFITVFCHVDHETLGVMAECRNQNFIFTLYMIILLAFKKKRCQKNSDVLFLFFSSFFIILFLRPPWSLVSWCWLLVCTAARAASDDAVLPSDDYQNREERRQNKVWREEARSINHAADRVF